MAGPSPLVVSAAVQSTILSCSTNSLKAYPMRARTTCPPAAATGSASCRAASTAAAAAAAATSGSALDPGQSFSPLAVLPRGWMPRACAAAACSSCMMRSGSSLVSCGGSSSSCGSFGSTGGSFSLNIVLRDSRSISRLRKASPGCRVSRFAGTRDNSLQASASAASETEVAAAGEKVQSKGSSSTPRAPPLNVVITGSSKGIGFALARKFLELGDNVVICSRSGERVDAAVQQLQDEFGQERVAGTACNVSVGNDVKALAEFAVQSFGRVDVWINNAGSNAYFYGPLIEADDEAIREIVATNTLGVMLCCREAMLLMKSQESGGHIFNMDGAGADGNATPRFAAYGATKRSLEQFTKSLQAELKMLKVNNVIVHNLSPGMVTTELLMSGANTPQAKFFINALAEPPEEVANFLVPLVREVPLSNKNSSTYIRFLTKQKAYSQIFARLLFRARKDRYVLED